jgi:hypothetical protein
MSSGLTAFNINYSIRDATWGSTMIAPKQIDITNLTIGESKLPFKITLDLGFEDYQAEQDELEAAARQTIAENSLIKVHAIVPPRGLAVLAVPLSVENRIFTQELETMEAVLTDILSAVTGTLSLGIPEISFTGGRTTIDEILKYSVEMDDFEF